MIYWAFELPNKPTEVVYGSKQEFSSWLKRRQLCPRAPTEWIVDVLNAQAATARFTYTHMPADEPLWTLTWGSPQHIAHHDAA